jgi:hypothetical protein
MISSDGCAGNWEIGHDGVQLNASPHRPAAYGHRKKLGSGMSIDPIENEIVSTSGTYSFA